MKAKVKLFMLANVCDMTIPLIAAGPLTVAFFCAILILDGVQQATFACASQHVNDGDRRAATFRGFSLTNFMKHLIPTLVALTGTAVAQPLSPQALSQINAISAEKAGRSPAQKKLQSSLVHLIREAAGKKAVAGAPALKSHVQRDADGRVSVEISADPSDTLKAAITAAGGEVTYESKRWKSLQARLLPAAIEAIAGRADVSRITTTPEKTVHLITNDADLAHKANTSRPLFGVTGAGVKVGVISDSVDHLAASQTSGELPMSLTVLPGKDGVEPGSSGEGTAMLEIVHDIAPDARLYFAAAGPGIAGFADSIILLKDAGCKIIVDDISYSTGEWQFQDDAIGQAVNAVVDAGVLYISSSGNEGSKKRGTSTTWEGDFVSGGAATSPITATGTVHSFGANNYNRTLTGENPSFAVLQWSDQYGASGNDYDLYVLSADGTSIVNSSTNTQDGTGIPLETLSGVEPGQRIVIWKENAAANRYLRLITPKAKLEVSTAGQTIGHAGTPKCICVASSDSFAAVDNAPNTFTTSSPVEASSSDGPHRMFYLQDGTPITAGNFSSTGGNNVQTPSITGGDGGNTSVPGFAPFYGTSAAAPATAAIAALVLSKNPTLTNAQLRTIMETSCLDIEAAGYDNNSGYGIVMADLALEKTLTPQEIWRNQNFMTYLPNGDASPSADPDFDGLSNLVEYALGTLPKTSTPTPFSVKPLTLSSMTFGYQKNLAATDVTLLLQHSTDLTALSWSTITPTSDVEVSTTGSVQIRSAVIPAASGGKDFFRAKVTAP